MSTPILSTPSIKGKDAKRFLTNLINVEKGKLTKQLKKSVKRIRQSLKQFAKVYNTLYEK